MAEWLLTLREESKAFGDLPKARLQRVLKALALQEYRFGENDHNLIFFVMRREEWEKLRQGAGLD